MSSVQVSVVIPVYNEEDGLQALFRLDPWEYDREMYKRRNEVERLFRRLKGFRRIFSRFDKLDVMFHRIHQFRAHRACARIDVDEHRPRADCQHHVGGGDPGDRRGDDFIAGADSGNAQRDLHGRGAIGEGAHRAAAEKV